MAATNHDTGRYDLLDGLRGVAALAVMFFHYTEHNDLHWFSHAWIAVDMFFVLSGFVIAHSYGEKIIAGLPLREFALIRLVRLWPLYFVGLSIGLLATCLNNGHAGADAVGTVPLLRAVALSVVGLPNFHTESWFFGPVRIGTAIFPIDLPAWSLFFELVVNLLFFAYVAHFRRVSSGRLALLALVVYVATLGIFRISGPGWSSETFVFGFPRVIFGFFTGALIYLWHKRLPKLAWPIALLVTSLALLCFVIDSNRIAKLDTLTLVPLTILLVSRLQAWERARPLCQWLGNMSYPVYILHYAIHMLVFELWDMQALSDLQQTLVTAGITVTVVMLLLTPDARVRRLLQRRLLPAKPRIRSA